MLKLKGAQIEEESEEIEARIEFKSIFCVGEAGSRINVTDKSL